ncbi:hypothetical protein CK203_003582 [Vitis vinifera]|uniref:Uncharacterized protein n=1 Tax=Vitis vinifera TaxID=29760 RepID=A0A438K8F7_VITVI|nr:hypothetical protein CK203_003582 [Vitis vinifera]
MSGWGLTVTVQKLPPPGPKKPRSLSFKYCWYKNLLRPQDPNELLRGVDQPQWNQQADIVNAPTRTHVREAKAMAATPADVKVQVENDHVLVISGEREAPNTVWTVTVKKLPPPEPKKPKTIEVQFA